MTLRSHEELNRELYSASADIIGWGLQAKKEDWHTLGVEFHLINDQFRPILGQCIIPGSSRGLTPLALVAGLDERLGALATECMGGVLRSDKGRGIAIYRRLKKAHLEKNCLHAFESGNNEQIRRALNVLHDFESGRNKARGSVVCISINELLSMKLPDRECVLDPIIPVKGLAMIHAMRGLGKTFTSLSFAHAVATGGSVWGFNAPKPRKVVFIDGEMPLGGIQERMEKITAGAKPGMVERGDLHFICQDAQKDPMPNLATVEGQQAVDQFIDPAEVVVLDNLATLARDGRENDAESWLPVQRWLLELRRRGKTVLLIHHSGKSGGQRGTSAKEDILDTVIGLRRPKDSSPEEGARFEVHFEKARSVCGDAVKPLEVRLVPKGEGLSWEIQELRRVLKDQILKMKKDGMSIREIAEDVGVGKSTVHRILN